MTTTPYDNPDEEEVVYPFPKLTAYPNESQSNEMAFYGSKAIDQRNKLSFRQQQVQDTTEALQNQYNLFKTIKSDLTTTGSSDVLNNEFQQLKKEDEEKTYKTLLEVYADPTLSKEVKKQATQHFINKKKVPFSLRDNFIINNMSQEDGYSEADKKAHENLIVSLEKSKQDLIETNNIINATKAGLKSLPDFSAGAKEISKTIAFDTIPFTHAARVNAVGNAYNDTTGLQTLQNLLLEGSNIKALSEQFQSLSNEEKKIFATKTLEKLKDIPGTDFHKYEIVKGIFDNPEMAWWETSLLNLGSILDAVIGGTIVKHPLRSTEAFIRWLKPEVGNTTAKLLGINAAIKTKPLDRVEPTIGPKVEVKTSSEIDDLSTVIQAGAKPTTSPLSPIGILDKTAPQKAQEARVAALLDDTNEVADALGTTKGNIITDVLPKNIGFISEKFPDLHQTLINISKIFSDTFEYNKYDPYYFDATVRNLEKERIFDAIQNNGVAFYQQSNSYMNEVGTTIHGTAFYGRNTNHGYDTLEEAQDILSNMKEVQNEFFKHSEIVNKDGQFYIKADYKKDFSIDDLLLKSNGGYDVLETATTVRPIPFSDKSITIKDNNLNPWIVNSLNRLPKHMVQGAMAAASREEQVLHAYYKVLNDEVMSVAAKKELDSALRWTQENEQWLSYDELRYGNEAKTIPNNLHLSENKFNEMYKGYAVSELMNNHFHRWANHWDRTRRVEQGQKALHNEKGEFSSYVLPVKPTEITTNHVWDMDSNLPIHLVRDKEGNITNLEGKTFVKLTEELNKSWDEVAGVHPEGTTKTSINKYDYALIGNKHSLEQLPLITLPQKTGYIHRHNLGPHFVVQTPKAVRVNGELITDPIILQRDFSRKIGAEISKERAEMLLSKIAQEAPDYTYSTVMGKEFNTISDLKELEGLKDEFLKFSKKRGEPLRTLTNDKSTLWESPTEAMVRTLRSVVHLNLWKDYDTINKTRFLDSFGDLLKNKGRMPNTTAEIIRPTGNLATEANIAKYQAALNQFEYLQNVKYKLLPTDAAWARWSEIGGDTIEKTGLDLLAGWVRKQGKKGNPFIRIPNSIASTLQLYLNPQRQWQIQTQTQWNLMALDPNHLHEGIPVIIPMLMALTSRSKYFKGYDNAIYEMAAELAAKSSSISKHDFDDIFKGLSHSGVFETVDMNMMLHGIIHNANYNLTPNIWEKFADIATQTITVPGKMAKAIGYTPAELSNTIGAYIFARNQFKKANPNKDIANPHHWELFKTHGWELTGSMSTRADIMPYQEGAWALLFKYQAITAKQLNLISSGKLLTKTQRGKLLASHIFWWGLYGIPGGVAVDHLVNEYASPEVKAAFNKHKGAVMDLMFNQGLSNVYEHIIGEPLNKTSSLAISKTMGPFNSSIGIPPIDVVMDLYELFVNKDPNNEVNLAAVNAMGTIGDFLKSIHRNVQINSFTEDTFKQFLYDYVSMAKGFTNAEHAYYMYRTAQAVDKMGKPTGLTASHIDAFGRIFGNRMKEELAGWQAFKEAKEEKKIIENRAKDIVNNIIKYNADESSPEYINHAQFLSRLISLEPARNQAEIYKEVNKRLRYHLNGKTQKENVLDIFFKKHQAGNPEALDNLRAITGASEDPNDKSLYNLLNTNIEK